MVQSQRTVADNITPTVGVDFIKINLFVVRKKKGSHNVIN